MFDRTTDQRRREASAKKEEENQKIRKCLDDLLELLGGTAEQKLGRVREMVREGADWQGIQEFLDQVKPRSPGQEGAESSVAEGSSRQVQQRSVKTPIAFDEWIAEVFCSPEQRDESMGME